LNAHARLVGIKSKFSQCSTSSQEIPALVEGLFDINESFCVFGRLAFPQSSLFINQTFNPQKNLLVRHFTPFA
jgi:hypothetical protein